LFDVRKSFEVAGDELYKKKRILSMFETRGITESQNPDGDPHCETEVHD
jgi:hypothetical protein